MSESKRSIVPQEVYNYRMWRIGLMDRLDSKPCRLTNGKYLEGWYNPQATIPDFLTHKEAAIIRRNYSEYLRLPYDKAKEQY